MQFDTADEDDGGGRASADRVVPVANGLQRGSAESVVGGGGQVIEPKERPGALAPPSIEAGSDVTVRLSDSTM
ncbi:hypothetical protein GCM10010446_06670 [Streptomyces enissocaesilis]|uniref:PASTA domain-containing protein n=1 Tax=Streptomyces enissocaesilis TaxID=332589 RepID=A0ABP6JAY7_9ACTN